MIGRSTSKRTKWSFGLQNSIFGGTGTTNTQLGKGISSLTFFELDKACQYVMETNPWIRDAATTLGVSVDSLRTKVTQAGPEDVQQLKEMLGLSENLSTSADQMKENLTKMVLNKGGISQQEIREEAQDGLQQGLEYLDAQARELTGIDLSDEEVQELKYFLGDLNNDDVDWNQL